MKRFVFLLGAATGYVLGSRAGRRRYEQVKSAAGAVWRSAPVQACVDAAQRGLDAATPRIQRAARRFVGYVGEGTQNLSERVTVQADDLQTRVTDTAEDLRRRSEDLRKRSEEQLEELRRRSEEQLEEMRRRVEEEVERSREASAESLIRAGDLRDEALDDLADDADEMLEPDDPRR
ncbi:hypothetical protein F8O01_08580 [Pseudoclavibacter chungangensis]|uniref:YtxH domain-containing protein n=1 Tax=Pseudoclavibacter chungangensis TaxID=587635 RepID=A0A7J5BSJ8_9MICO|nr:hypothetical protein [Pseudoclavibacter chungangensis]KAB1657290.1 hypothetical protein F8O01_08580 [Pseudoclavibacter chungangensis]NYJ66263.1 DNA anti-recombination protein RmuC [Pseudoclavibacter chungangensis]